MIESGQVRDDIGESVLTLKGADNDFDDFHDVVARMWCKAPLRDLASESLMIIDEVCATHLGHIEIAQPRDDVILQGLAPFLATCSRADLPGLDLLGQERRGIVAQADLGDRQRSVRLGNLGLFFNQLGHSLVQRPVGKDAPDLAVLASARVADAGADDEAALFSPPNARLEGLGGDQGVETVDPLGAGHEGSSTG